MSTWAKIYEFQRTLYSESVYLVHLMWTPTGSEEVTNVLPNKPLNGGNTYSEVSFHILSSSFQVPTRTRFLLSSFVKRNLDESFPAATAGDRKVTLSEATTSRVSSCWNVTLVSTTNQVWSGPISSHSLACERKAQSNDQGSHQWLRSENLNSGWKTQDDLRWVLVPFGGQTLCLENHCTVWMFCAKESTSTRICLLMIRILQCPL